MNAGTNIRPVSTIASVLATLCLAVEGQAEVVLSTDFTGRTVNGKTASNIDWTTSGVSDPGDLTWVLEGGGPAGTNLFDTANSAGHFAPDLNIENEGPWSVTIPLTLTAPQILLEDVVLDWQHFNNGGAFQTVSRSADWTVSVTGSISGKLESVTAVDVNGSAGIETLTFPSPLVLTSGETYDLKIFVVGNGPGNNTGLNAVTLNGEVSSEPDTTPPGIASLSPEDDATGASTFGKLVITFDETVQKGTGNLEIRSGANDSVLETIAVTSDAVMVEGAEVTIDPADNLPGMGDVYVLLAAGSFADLSGNEFAGIADATIWNFTTAEADVAGPVVTALSPADNADGVSLGTTLEITFDEAVEVGSGNIVVRQSGGDGEVESIDVTSGSVTISDATVSIALTTLLSSDTGYYVQVDAGAVKDLAGNAFAGILDSSTWNFVTADVPLLAVEFNDDDQDGFEIWPSPLAGTSSTAEFETDPVATSGTTTVTVTTSTGFGVPGNRGGLTDGDPPGFTYSALYEDLLHALTPTGVLTLDFGGLNPNQAYQFTLYAWDPGDGGNTSAPVKEWTVTEGTGTPEVATVDWNEPLLNNDSYALVFEITTTDSGTFQVTNTDGLPQSAINGFTLTSLAPVEPFRFSVSQDGADLLFEWESQAGMFYNLKTSADLAADFSTWTLVKGDIPATPATNTEQIARPADPARFYRVEEFPAPPVVILSENFDDAAALPAGWTAGAFASDTGTTIWEVGNPAGGSATGPASAFSPPNCVATNIGADYGLATDIWLRSPEIDLTGAARAELIFQQFLDIEPDFDSGTVRVLRASDNTVLGSDLLGPLDGVGTDWQEVNADFPVEALGETIKIEFRFQADDFGNFAGWYIDNVVVTVPAS